SGSLPESSPMAKSKSIYVCEACGASQPKWAGQCPDCGAWNTLTETAAPTPRSTSTRGSMKAALDTHVARVQRLPDIAPEALPRVATGASELDRVLGGGLVPGSVILIGGDPGIGKSTLLLQVMARLATQKLALYVTGEESLEQVHMRAQRLSVADNNLAVLAETCVERILTLAKQETPDLMVIDSIQTVF